MAWFVKEVKYLLSQDDRLCVSSCTCYHVLKMENSPVIDTNKIHVSGIHKIYHISTVMRTMQFYSQRPVFEPAPGLQCTPEAIGLNIFRCNTKLRSKPSIWVDNQYPITQHEWQKLYQECLKYNSKQKRKR